MRILEKTFPFSACFGIILLCSFPRVGPRIWHNPLPDSEVRYYHEMGDGDTEMGVLSAHAYWSQYGYNSTHFLPCLFFLPRETRTDLVCSPYTHYPPGMYLLSSVLLKITGWEQNHERALQWTRVILYFLSTVVASLALCILGRAIKFGPVTIIATSFAWGLSYGWMIFADNLFGHGLVLALEGVLLGVVLIDIKRKNHLYFSLSFVTIFLSVELIPTIFTAPLLLFIWPGRQHRDKLKEVRSLWWCALAAFGLAMFLRLGQNALQIGLWHAIGDWVGTIYYRITGQHIFNSLPEQLKVSLSFVYFKTYIWAWLGDQRVMITRYGQLWMGLSVLWLLLERKFRELLLLVGLFFVAMEWNFLFIQHSFFHSFTTRYVLWPYVVSLGLVFPRFKNVLSSPWKGENLSRERANTNVLNEVVYRP